MNTLSLLHLLQSQSTPAAATGASSAFGSYRGPQLTMTTPSGSVTATPSSSAHFGGLIKISPTTAVIDANTGLPTAAVAEGPLMAMPSGTHEAALPPEAAATVSGETQASIMQNYVLQVAAAALNQELRPPAFRLPPAPPPPTTSSDTFVSLALASLVQPGDSSSDSKDDSKSTSSDASSRSMCCVVCSDIASGFHYGVFACEGCKGFFRRSIQQKISYRPCSKSQQCAIVRNNRNRCQYCRLKKCIAVGMSRDAVRFGRVPKREKVKMVEEMQRASVRSLIDQMTVELEDENGLAVAITLGFQEFGEAVRRELLSGTVARHCGTAPSSSACTSTANGTSFSAGGMGDHVNQFLKSLSAAVHAATAPAMPEGSSSGCPVRADAYLPLIKSVVAFSESVRGFQLLLPADRVRLLKCSIFQVLLLRLATLKDVEGTEFLFANCGPCCPEALRELQTEAVTEFMHRFRTLKLDERQVALFTALVLCQSDAGCCNAAATIDSSQANLVKMLQDKLWLCLQKTFFHAAPLDVTVTVQSLFSSLADLKRLNDLHDCQLRQAAFTGPLPPLSVPSRPHTVSEAPKAMSALRKALEAPLQPRTSVRSGDDGTSSVGSRLSISERHPAVASLLSQPPSSVPVVAGPAKGVPPPPSVSSSVTETEETGEDEQPLNLCVRDQQRQPQTRHVSLSQNC